MRYFAFLACFCLIASAQAQRALPGAVLSGNPSNDKLLNMPEYGQAAMLSKATGYNCMGKKPFYMGTEKHGANKGVSFWSVTCDNNGKKFMIAVSPDAIGSTKVFSCNLFTRKPLECYEKLQEK